MGNQTTASWGWPGYAMSKQRTPYHTEFVAIRKITFLCLGAPV